MRGNRISHALVPALTTVAGCCRSMLNRVPCVLCVPACLRALRAFLLACLFIGVPFFQRAFFWRAFFWLPFFFGVPFHLFGVPFFRRAFFFGVPFFWRAFFGCAFFQAISNLSSFSVRLSCPKFKKWPLSFSVYISYISSHAGLSSLFYNVVRLFLLDCVYILCSLLSASRLQM